jgi:quercetin dioxygenase-like cupin family protein
MSVTYLVDEDLWPTFPKTRGMVLAQGKSMLMYYIEYDPNTTFPEHSHPHEQVGYCVSGEGELGIGDEVIRIVPGCGYHVPSNVVHYEKNTGHEPLICVDIFSPVRDDLSSKYFKREYFVDKGT